MYPSTAGNSSPQAYVANAINRAARNHMLLGPIEAECVGVEKLSIMVVVRIWRYTPRRTPRPYMSWFPGVEQVAGVGVVGLDGAPEAVECIDWSMLAGWQARL